MKINVTVDLSEFYSEEDGADFSSQIKDAIAYKVRTEILSEWKTKIGEEFSNEVKLIVSSQKESLITNELSELFESAMVKKGYNGEMISIKDYVQSEFEKTHLSERSLNDKLSQATRSSAETISKQLKDRYDLLFASTLVSKMNELGMLKENVAKLILES